MATATEIIARKHKPGRPERYNLALAEAICEGISRGLSRTAAGALCQVGLTTITKWIERKREFAWMVAQAEATYKDELIRVLRTAAANSTKQGFQQWQAGAWLLERRFPEEFALRNPDRGGSDQGVVINLIMPGGQQQQLTINAAMPTTSSVPPVDDSTPQ